LRKSESTQKLSDALAKAQKEFKPLKKNAINPFFAKANDPEKGRYADLSAVIEATQESLNTYEIAPTQEITTNFEHQSVSVATTLLHSSGEWIEYDPLELPARDWTAQGIGATTTYTRRYSLSGALNVAPEADDDGNAASGRTDGNHQPTQGKPVQQPSNPPRQSASKPIAKKTESEKKPDPPAAKPEPDPSEQPKKEEPKAETPQHKLRDLLASIYKDPKANVNGKSLKDFVFKNTLAEEVYKNTSSTNLGALTEIEAMAAYNSLKDAWGNGTLNELIGTEGK
jgi:hypothetical protein